MATTLNLAGLGLSCLEGMPILITIDCLDVSGNKLQSFYGLPSLPKMRILDARHCLITTFAGMSLQPSLKELLLEGNPLVLHPHVAIMALLAVGSSLERIDGREITAHEREKAQQIGSSESFAAMCVSLGLVSLNVSDASDDRFYRELLPVLKDEYLGRCASGVDRLHSYQTVIERLHGDPRNPAQWIVVGDDARILPSSASQSRHAVETPTRGSLPAAFAQHQSTPTYRYESHQQVQQSNSARKLTRHDMNVGLGRSVRTPLLNNVLSCAKGKRDSDPPANPGQRCGDVQPQTAHNIESLHSRREDRLLRDFGSGGGGRVALDLTPREMQCFSIMMLDNLCVTMKPGAWTTGSDRSADLSPLPTATGGGRLLLEDAVLRLSFSDGCISVFESPRQVPHHSAMTSVFRTPVATVPCGDMLNVVLREIMDVRTASSKYVVTVLLTSTVGDTNETRRWTEMDVTPMSFREIDAARGVFKALMMMKCTASELAELYQDDMR